MHDPPPAALCVQALADARRSLSTLRTRNEPIGDWLADETRFPGIKENAATLAVLEIPEHRQEASQAYTSRHPDRLAVLHEVLAVLEQLPSERCRVPNPKTSAESVGSPSRRRCSSDTRQG
jgi:hypothetical protein